jgi:hypothetical protein
MFTLFSRYLSGAQCSLIASANSGRPTGFAIKPPDHAVAPARFDVMAVCSVRFAA